MRTGNIDCVAARCGKIDRKNQQMEGKGIRFLKIPFGDILFPARVTLLGKQTVAQAQF